MNANFFVRLFFCYELETDVNVIKKKLKCSVFKKFIFKTIIVSDSIFFFRHTVRFLLNLICYRHYKPNYKPKQKDLTKCRSGFI